MLRFATAQSAATFPAAVLGDTYAPFGTESLTVTGLTPEGAGGYVALSSLTFVVRATEGGEFVASADATITSSGAASGTAVVAPPPALAPDTTAGLTAGATLWAGLIAVDADGTTHTVRYGDLPTRARVGQSLTVASIFVELSD